MKWADKSANRYLNLPTRADTDSRIAVVFTPVSLQTLNVHLEVSRACTLCNIPGERLWPEMALFSALSYSKKVVYTNLIMILHYLRRA